MTSTAAPRPAKPAWLQRLAPRYEVSCWTAAVVRVVAAATIEERRSVLRTPDHYLGAAWRPAEGGPSRWPDVVVIGSPAPDNALAELFAQLPRDARVFLVDLDQVDAALGAMILLRADRNLEPYQREGIERFVAAEQARTAARLTHDYSDDDAGYARFRARAMSPGTE